MTRKIFWGLCLIGLISIMTMSINVCADDSKTSAEKINEDLNNGILDDETALKYKLLAIYNQSEVPEKYRSNKKMLSWTQIAAELYNTWHTLSNESRNKLSPYLMPQFLNSTSKDSSDVSILSEPPSTDLPTYLNSTNLSLTYNTSAHFTIHYTDSGTNVVFNASDRINGVPRYVVELGNLFEYTWTTEVENYGFKGPLDGDITNDLKNRLHVYIRNIDTTLGSTYPFAINTSTGKGLANISHTFIEIENDFDGFVGSREGLMNVTTAHEFFGADLLKLG